MGWLIVIGATILLFLLVTVLSLGGRCRKCGSLRTWRHSKYRRDSHRNVRYEHVYRKCGKCGHEDFLEEIELSPQTRRLYRL